MMDVSVPDIPDNLDQEKIRKLSKFLKDAFDHDMVFIIDGAKSPDSHLPNMIPLAGNATNCLPLMRYIHNNITVMTYADKIKDVLPLIDCHTFDCMKKLVEKLIK